MRDPRESPDTTEPRIAHRFFSVPLRGLSCVFALVVSDRLTVPITALGPTAFLLSPCPASRQSAKLSVHVRSSLTTQIITSLQTISSSHVVFEDPCYLRGLTNTTHSHSLSSSIGAVHLVFQLRAILHLVTPPCRLGSDCCCRSPLSAMHTQAALTSTNGCTSPVGLYA